MLDLWRFVFMLYIRDMTMHSALSALAKGSVLIFSTHPHGCPYLLYQIIIYTEILLEVDSLGTYLYIQTQKVCFCSLSVGSCVFWQWKPRQTLIKFTCSVGENSSLLFSNITTYASVNVKEEGKWLNLIFHMHVLSTAIGYAPALPGVHSLESNDLL